MSKTLIADASLEGGCGQKTATAWDKDVYRAPGAWHANKMKRGGSGAAVGTGAGTNQSRRACR